MNRFVCLTLTTFLIGCPSGRTDEVPPATCTPDTLEANDTSDAAIEVPTDGETYQDISLSDADEDWFLVTLCTAMGGPRSPQS